MGGNEAAQQQDQQQTDLDDQESTTPEPIEGEVSVELEMSEDEQIAAEEAQRQPKRKRVRDMRVRIKQLNTENKGRREENDDLRQERDRLRAENEALKNPDQQQQQQLEATDAAPTMESCGYNSTEFEKQYAAWNEKHVRSIVEKVHKETGTGKEIDEEDQGIEDAISAHYERASNFKVADYEQTEDVAIEALGQKLVQAIQTGVPDSERLIYWLGKNPEEAARVKVEFDANPGTATFNLGVLSSKLILKPKGKIPPDPETRVDGGGNVMGTALLAKYTRLLQEATNDADNPLEARRKVRAEAEANGVKLPYNA